MALQDAVNVLQYWAGQVDAIQAAPDYVDPTAANVDVYALSFARSGEFGVEAAAQGRDLHTLVTQIVIQGIDPLTVEQRGEGVLEEYVNLLRNDPTLEGDGSTGYGDIVFPITYQGVRTVAQDKTSLTWEVVTVIKVRGSF